MVTSQVGGLLNVYEEGYYYKDYRATDWGYYNIYFRVIFKVGQPSAGDRIPVQHLHYNYINEWEDQLTSYGEIEYVNGIPLTEATKQENT